MNVAGAAVKAFDNVAAVFDDAKQVIGQEVSVRGTFVQEAGAATAQLADDTNVVTSMVPSVMDSDWAISLGTTPAVRGVFEALPRQGFSAGLDVRAGVVEVTGTLTAKPRMLLSPPAHYLSIEPTAARIVPKSELPKLDDFGFIGD